MYTHVDYFSSVFSGLHTVFQYLLISRSNKMAGWRSADLTRVL